MYKLANTFIKTLPPFSVVRYCSSVTKRHHTRTTFKSYSNYVYLFTGLTLGTYIAYESTQSCDEDVAIDNAVVIDNVTENMDSKEMPVPEKWTLYQYATCPFCCKVRAFLEYYGFDYETVEVNPVSRKEIAFSDYRKVPFVKSENNQINDSSLVISVLKSCMMKKGDIGSLISYYPFLLGEKGTKGDYQNKYNIMYQEGFTHKHNDAIREEARWRRWVDEAFVHTLSPNIYRTIGESLQAMEYITNVGNFSEWERKLIYYSGAAAMYVIGKRLKKRYHLRNDVRESLYEEARRWTHHVGSDRPFMGGKQPNLADLNMYGVISAIEGLDTFDDLMKNTKIGPWYKRMKSQVKSHRGKEDPDWLHAI